MHNINNTISFIKNQNNILEKKNISLIQQIYNLNIQLNIITDDNLKFKNFITQNINNIEHVRAIPVIDYYENDNNIISYIESLKSDNDYLNKQNILLKLKSDNDYLNKKNILLKFNSNI